MQKVKRFVCPECKKVYNSLTTWSNHVQKQHPGIVPEGYTLMRYFYYLQTGKTGNSCIVCKEPTEWNEGTGKYERFCKDPACKQKYREMFKNRMINKYGKTTLLNDPEQQRKMLEAKKSHGEVRFPDGESRGYNSTYEKDFLEMMSSFIRCNGADIMSPSPHTYYYDYTNPEDKENEGRKFYIPDYFIPSLNLEIEIKQNTSTHPKILRVDKVKEAQKDTMMAALKKNTGINYIKITDKDYSAFFDLLLELKETLPARTTEPSAALETQLGIHAATNSSVVSSSSKDVFLAQIIEFVNRVSNWKYGWVKNGQATQDFGENDEDFNAHYHTLTPAEFGRHKCGICWDYAAYVKHILLTKFKLMSEAYYIKLGPKGDPNAITHTFVCFPFNGDHYYIETAYKGRTGVYTFNSVHDVISWIAMEMWKDSGKIGTVSNPKIFCTAYSPSMFYGYSPREFERAVENQAAGAFRMQFNRKASLKRISDPPKVQNPKIDIDSIFNTYGIGIAQEGFFDFFKKYSPEEKNSLLQSWKEKIFGKEGLLGTPTTSKYFTLKKVLVDGKRGIISIQHIKIPVLISRIRDTYEERRLDYIFDRTYKESDIKLYRKKRLSRGQMRITSLTCPIFFALELTILFKDLYQKYRDPSYAHIANEIYRLSWLAVTDLRVPVPVNMSRLKNLNPAYTLKPHQSEFLQLYPKLKNQLGLDGYYLAFDQGLGKTLTASALAEVLEADRVYIVCPNTLCDVWANETKAYFQGRYRAAICKKPVETPTDVKFFIINQESIKSIMPYAKLPGKKMIIVDEAHNFRIVGGQRVEDLIALKKAAQPSDVLMMSGTPIKATPNEMVPALKMLDPLFTDHAAQTYNVCFKFDSYMAMDIVRNRFGQVIYRKTKEELQAAGMLELPKKFNEDLYLKISAPQKFYMSAVRDEVQQYFHRFYDEMAANDADQMRDFEALIRKYSTANRRETEYYLRMVTRYTDRERDPENTFKHELDVHFFETFIENYIMTNPAVSKEEGKRIDELERKFIRLRNSAMGRAIGIVYPPRRSEMFISIFEENKKDIEDRIASATKKTVIFSQLLPVVQHITNALNKDGIGALSITGSAKGRSSIIDRFKNDPSIQVIVATSQTMGTGVTLTEATQMFFFGPPWRSTDFDQCCDRIYRIGQTEDCYIYNVRLDTPEFNLSDRMNKILNWSSEMFHSAIDTDQVDGASEGTLMIPASPYLEEDPAMEDLYDAVELLGTDVSDEVFIRDAMEYFRLWTEPLDRFYEEDENIEAMEAAGYSKESQNPIFVVLTTGSSPLAYMVRAVTGDDYGHACIAFNPELNPLYSMGMKKVTAGIKKDHGFVATNTSDMLWGDNTGYAVYVTYVNDIDYKKMQNRLQWFIDHSDEIKFSFAGIIRIFFNLKSPKRKKWFCSAFVAEIIGAGKSLVKDSTLYRPDTLREIDNMEFLMKGDNLREHDAREAAKLLSKLKSLPEGHHLALEASNVENPNKFVYSWFMHDGRENSLVRYHGKNWRDRVEALVVNGDKVYLAIRPDGSYRLPGGSTETKRTNKEQVNVECEEEAGFSIKNIVQHSTYFTEYDSANKRPEWMDKLPVQYDGIINTVYTAEFDKIYTRPVGKRDQSWTIKHGQWVSIDRALTFLRPEHSSALKHATKRYQTSLIRKDPYLIASESSMKISIGTPMYHGSPKRIAELNPYISAHKISAVYATPDKRAALCFAGKKWNDFFINMCHDNGHIVLTEIHQGAFERFLKTSGYIYTFENDGTFKQARGMADFEYICEHQITPTAIEEIPNVYEALQNAGVQLIHYPKLPRWIKSHDDYLTKLEKKYNADRKIEEKLHWDTATEGFVRPSVQNLSPSDNFKKTQVVATLTNVPSTEFFVRMDKVRELLDLVKPFKVIPLDQQHFINMWHGNPKSGLAMDEQITICENFLASKTAANLRKYPVGAADALLKEAINNFLSTRPDCCVILNLSSPYDYKDYMEYYVLRIDMGLVTALKANGKLLMNRAKDIYTEWQMSNPSFKGKGSFVKNPEKMEFFHVSREKLTELKPIPSRTAMHGENTVIARISVASSVMDCFGAINLHDGEEYHIYQPVITKEHHVFKPNPKMVPDVNDTGEYWILEPVKVEDTGTVLPWLVGDNGKKIIVFHKRMEESFGGKRYIIQVSKEKWSGRNFYPGADRRGRFTLYSGSKIVGKAVINFKAGTVELLEADNPSLKTSFAKWVSENCMSNVSKLMTPAMEALLTKRSFGGLERREWSPQVIEEQKDDHSNMLFHCKTDSDIRGAMFFDKKSDEIKAYVGVDPYGMIIGLWVSKELRRNGYGSKLLNIAANSYGANSLFVAKANLPAIHLYRDKMGWETIETTPHGYKMAPKDI